MTWCNVLPILNPCASTFTCRFSPVRIKYWSGWTAVITVSSISIRWTDLETFIRISVSLRMWLLDSPEKRMKVLKRPSLWWEKSGLTTSSLSSIQNVKEQRLSVWTVKFRKRLSGNVFNISRTFRSSIPWNGTKRWKDAPKISWLKERVRTVNTT